MEITSLSASLTRAPLSVSDLGRVSAPRGAASGDATAFDKAAKDFEAMFMAQMMQPMLESVATNDLFGGGHGEDSMRLFLVQEYGKAVAQGSDGGLGAAIKRELLKAQESASSVSTSLVPASSGPASSSSVETHTTSFQASLPSRT